MAFCSEKQKAIFKTLEDSGELIFACGVKGVSANIVGQFVIRRRGNEDRLEMGDGTQHVHVEWDRVNRIEVGEYQGEGMLTFFDKKESLFTFYRPTGRFLRDLNSSDDIL